MFITCPKKKNFIVLTSINFDYLQFPIILKQFRKIIDTNSVNEMCKLLGLTCSKTTTFWTQWLFFKKKSIFCLIIMSYHPLKSLGQVQKTKHLTYFNTNCSKKNVPFWDIIGNFLGYSLMSLLFPCIVSSSCKVSEKSSEQIMRIKLQVKIRPKPKLGAKYLTSGQI